MKRTANKPQPAPSPAHAAPPRASSSASRSPHSPSSTTAASPPFGKLLLAAFRSVGIEYIALDHLRKAKKNALNEREYGEMWKLLHDLVVVILADFELDTDVCRSENTVFDAANLPLWQELARFYLYEWGFVCAELYEVTAACSPSVLLLAVGWVLAHSRFFERQHSSTLQLYMNGDAPRLPPYPNDVAVSPAAVSEAVVMSTTDVQQLKERLASDIDLQPRLRQLQALVGRIHNSHRDLNTSIEYHNRMLVRLEAMQRENGAADEDELIPAYALQVFADSKTRQEAHLRVIAERLQMLEDEKLFYKWINSLLLQYTPRTPRDDNKAHSVSSLAARYTDLHHDFDRAQQIMLQRVELYQKIVNLYAAEKKKWQQKTKTRTQQVKMDEKMEKLKHEIETSELWDVQKLFLDCRDDAHAAPHAKKVTEAPPFVQEADLDRLQQQLERVMHEITTDYCKVELI